MKATTSCYREITDELMYEIRELTGQEYIDRYATKRAETLPTDVAKVRLGEPADREPDARPRWLTIAGGPTEVAGRLAFPMADLIDIVLPDGSTRQVATGTTAGGLAEAIGPRLGRDAVIAVVDGVERDLDWVLVDGDRVEIVVPASDRGRYTLRHSTAHVLAQAVLDLFPGATFGIGPPIEDGFYYDFDLPEGRTFTPDDLERIDARMREIIAEKQPFVRDEISEADASKRFADAQVQARDHHRQGRRPDVGN